MPVQLSVASTDEVDAPDRTAFWEEYNERQLVALRCMTVHDGGLRAREMNLDLGGLCVADIVGNPHVVERSAQHVERTPKASVFLTHLVRGSAFFVHADGCLRLRAGDTVVYDASRPYLFGFETQMHQVLLDLPHEVLPRLGPARESLARGAAVALGGSRSRALSRLMREMLRASATDADSTTRDTGELVEAAIAIIAPENAPAAAVADAAVNEVRRRLGDADLTPDGVAQAVGVSTRHLNRLLAREGRTLGELISTERLDAAHRDLLDPACQHLRVADIAARWGFSSQAHFTRAFRRAFATTPGRMREALTEVTVKRSGFDDPSF